MTEFVKSKIHWQNSIQKTFQASLKNLAECNTVKQVITEVPELIYEEKNDYCNVCQAL